VRSALAIPRSIEVVTDAAALFALPQADCAIIATPPATHFTLASEALARGMHVLVEKPMVTSVREAEALAALAAQSQRVVMVGYQYLFNDHIRALKRWLETRGSDSGRIFFHMLAEHAVSPERSDVSVLWDAGPHALAIHAFLFGSERVEEVCGAHGSATPHGHVATTIASVRFDRGPMLTLSLSWRGVRKRRRITFVGEGAEAVFDESNPAGALLVDGGTGLGPRAVEPSGGTTAEESSATSREPLRNELDHFFSCIRTGNRPLTDVAFGCEITHWLAEIEKMIS
jgi:predicted dehydrogenase